jgi:hypothetical protein
MCRAFCSVRKAQRLSRKALSSGRKPKRFERKDLVLCAQGSELGSQSYFSGLTPQKGLLARPQAWPSEP